MNGYHPLAAIPSPPSAVLHVGPLMFRYYGVIIAIAVVVAIWITGRRLERAHAGGRDDVMSVAMWVVPAGVLGARAYHVLTAWDRYAQNPLRALSITNGGLSVIGAIAAGTAVGVWRCRRQGISVGAMLTAAAPALAIAQAIGRWGCWFNQELMGRPTSLPWGWRIEPASRPSGYEAFATFQPTFLYESLWSLLLALALIVIERRVALRPGRLFAIYVAGYAVGRAWIESLRIDPAPHVVGLRFNEWVAIVVALAAVGFLAWDARRSASDAGTTTAV